MLLCAAYLLPGQFGREPWKNADITAFGYMSSLAEGRSPWTAPALAGLPGDGALLPYWLGAVSIKALPFVDPANAARVPFALLLAATLALIWYSTLHLARTEAAQPVAFAFGGEASPVDYARALADGAVLATIASLGLLQLGHETTPELVQLSGVALFMWVLAAAPTRPRLAAASAVSRSRRSPPAARRPSRWPSARAASCCASGRAIPARSGCGRGCSWACWPARWWPRPATHGPGAPACAGIPRGS